MQMAALSTRRIHPRVQAGFPVRLQLGERLVTVRAHDISMTGLKLDPHTEVPDRIPLRIPLPGQPCEAIITGHVERRDEHGVAISFARIDWEDLLKLAKYLSSKL